ncbi:unnamed protein product, partial [Pseudo-nitzschia multistriata]
SLPLQNDHWDRTTFSLVHGFWMKAGELDLVANRG